MALRIRKAIVNRIPFKKEEKSLALRIYKAIDATSVKKKLSGFFFFLV